MKMILLSVLIVPVSVFAARVGDSQVRKGLDGRAVSCAQESDLGKTGYLARDLQVQGIEGDIQVNLTLPFVGCAKLGGDFVWIDREPVNPVEGRDLFGNPMRIWTSDHEFVMTNKNSKLIGSIPVTGPRLVTSFRFPLEQVLDDQSRADLDRGLQVGANLHVFPRAVISIERNGEKVLFGRRTGGAYYIRFVLFREAGVLKVGAAEIR